ncbi:DUF2510 domain-containing protein [Microbacterium hydrocarbonoxydans]|uniref:DUF2510 domain-containing protein n=1 Tax=Microbacterium hydrocarbonoxydans TaxID=273678 RepID=UPI0007BB6306|nr:DUF2510 domain-containing protein [Microbacterium hydrocarbonoxydans]GAT74837.1 hypothetical protein MHM582_3345 [Microbacterium sp. HM58-2]
MTTPAGWYDDGSGRQRWWDGQQWTEHFAPVAEPETPAEPESPVVPETPTGHEAPTEPGDATTEPGEPGEPDVPASGTSEPASETVITPDAPAETVVAPEPAPSWSAPGATAPTTPLPGEVPPYAAAAAAYPSQPQPYPAPAAPAYPGASAGYPGTTGAYPPAAQSYPVAGYAAPYGAAAPAGPAPLSVVGLVGLGLAVVGTIIACIPVIAAIGWVILGAGFIVSLISLFLKGRKWPGITGLIVSVVGTIISVVVIVVWFATSLGQAIESGPDAPPSIGIEEPEEGEDGGTGFGAPAEVVEGKLGEKLTVQQISGSADVTLTAASWSATNGTDFPPVNGGFLTVQLTWTGVDGETYVDPLYFSAETAEGTEGDYDFFTDGQIEGDGIGAGETVEGFVTFDVAQSASYVVIIQNEFFEEIARISVEPAVG